MFGLTTFDLLILWRDCCLALAWFVAIIYCLSGVQDLAYDIVNYVWRIYRRIAYRDRPRLTLERLRLRAQQRIAVIVPAWNEADVIDKMVEGILHRVEYKNFTIFVGTYPNDLATQHEVDVLAAAHAQVVKVVTQRPGPTSKADCLNNVYLALQRYEAQQGVNFDIIVMHDSEDVVHPYSFMLYNYLLPRVDVVQLPVLPLPTPLTRMTHWTYADEFAENHMKDVVAREKMSGFVPYAGTGTGFSRRALAILAQDNHQLFNEGSMTEDYSLSKRVRDMGLTSIFVNLVLADDRSSWWTPLCKRPAFIANWAYFPMDFTRSVRQKTRWIVGISLQEWELGGWHGSWLIKENLLKDRKIFISQATTFLGYALFLYFIISWLGEQGVLPFKWLPIIHEGTTLYALVVVDTGLMFFRMFERIIFVSMVYGLIGGLTSIPRIFYANIINGLAAYLALYKFIGSRWGTPVSWDKTEHQEGVGAMPVIVENAHKSEQGITELACADLDRLMGTLGTWDTICALGNIDPHSTEDQRQHVLHNLALLSEHEDHHVRAVVARVIGGLGWPELTSVVRNLLYDPEWLVRANAALSLMQLPHFVEVLKDVLMQQDRYAREVLINTMEQDDRALSAVFQHIDEPDFILVRDTLLMASTLIRKRYEHRADVLEPAGNGAEVNTVQSGVA